jgi:hypothetical protein
MRTGDRATILRKIVSYMWIAVGIGALFACYTFFARYDENAKIERRKAVQEAERARKDVEMLGGDSLKIVQFFASAMVIPKGGKGQLCYGVANATSVEIEPGVTERTWPALSHCVEIAPKRDTEYTLTAKDATGRATEKKLTVMVR